MLPHDEFIPSSNNYRQRIEETSLLLAMPSSLNPHRTFHEKKINGSYNENTNFGGWIQCFFKVLDWITFKKFKFHGETLEISEMSPRNLPEIAKVEILLADHLKVQHVADSAKLGLKGRVC